MKHKNTRTRKNWKPKQKQERNIPKPNGREIPVINGNVKVGSKSFVGSATVTKQDISIGENNVISVGSVLKNNVKSI